MAIKEIKSSIEVVGRGAHEWENVKAINDNFAEIAGGGGGNTSITTDDITDATTVGKNVLTATDAAAARAAIGAGTSNLALGTTGTTALAGNTAIPAASSTTPAAPGTAAVGTATTWARADHVHPAQTTITGNAGTATTLQTARNIILTGGATGSASFNGSANASITVTLTPASVTGAVAAKTQIAALTPIADPATANAEAVATLLNSVIAALKA